MKTLFRVLIFALVIMFVAVGTAFAGTVNAVYFAHGGNIYLDGTYVIGTATTISERVALADDGKFVKMGPDSWITLKFPDNLAAFPDGSTAADLRIDVIDALYRANAQILVSLNGTTWTLIGDYADTANIDLDLIGPVKYVKVNQDGFYIDPTFPLLGFDLDAVVALHSGTLPFAQITKPAPDVTVSGSVLFEALYWDDDPSGVQWAIRHSTCAANTGTVFGNVDGFSDPFSWDGHTFQTTADTSSWEDGTYCFVFNPTESGGEADIRLTQFNVVSNNLPPVVDAKGPYAGQIGQAVPVAGTASDPDGDELTYSWAVNNAHCTLVSPTTLSPSVTCTDIGTFTLTLTASDGQAAPVSDTATVAITDPLLVKDINACSHGTYDRYQYLETKFVSSLGSGTVTPVVSSTSLNPAVKYLVEVSGVFYAGGVSTYDIRADAKYTQDTVQRFTTPDVWTDVLRNYEIYGPGLLEMKVDDDFVDWGDYQASHRYTTVKQGTGAPITLQFQIYDVYAQNNTGGLCVSLFEFENSAPIANPGGPYLGAVNASVPFNGSASSDPDGDPLTFAWNFGDTAVGEGATPSHMYTAAGIYDVCLKVNDGFVDSLPVCTIAVVYDPAAGFVTGGGWIWSPAGAYKADLTLEGKATFGFVSKYKKGTTVPEGNTEFHFNAGSLTFKSSSYEWLVVAGTMAQFKGEGTINGVGSYKFMITADDGSPDDFRIKITDSVTDSVVYDNGSQQALGGGSIVIHK